MSVWLPASAFGQAGMTLTGRTYPWTQEIGDHLPVDVHGLKPGEKLTLRLVDEAGDVVSEETFEAPANGAVKGVEAWPYSGVQGCGMDSLKSDYSFSTYQEAESVLNNRTFKLELLDPLGDSEASLSFQWELPGQMRLFWSDASGCPRFHFDLHENVYLSAYRVPGNLESLNLFMTRLGQEVVDGRIQEVRREFSLVPQSLADFGAGEVWTGLVWATGSSFEGDFNGIVRTWLTGHVGPAPLDPYYLRDEDLFLNGNGDGGTKVGGDGIRILETCPDCLGRRGCFVNNEPELEPGTKGSTGDAEEISAGL